jgi:hypothetical protein
MTAESVRQEVSDRLCRDLGLNAADVSCNGWEVLDFSSCFALEWKRAGRREGAYVKVPKAEMARRTVLPTESADRELASSEFRSLHYLAKHWVSPDLRVAYVRPLLFYSDLNALVTVRVWASDLLLPFRRVDFAGRLWPRAGAKLESVLSRLGSALARFHAQSHGAEGAVVESFHGSDVGLKIRKVLDDLSELGAPRRSLLKLRQKFDACASVVVERPLIMSLKGLDIRNILVDEETNVWLLDPGKLKRDFSEADLARLLVTCRLVWWGTPWFLLGLRPQHRYEQVLVSAYDRELPVNRTVLSVYVAKELAKHWRAAYLTVRRKSWHPAVKRLLLRLYVDNFYEREINRQVELV